jgi:hypothetical protein
MIRSASLAGIALGLAVAVYMSRVPPVNRPASTGRVVRLATVPQGAALPTVSTTYFTEFHGRKYSVSWAALDIPCWMVGGEVLSINGNVSRRYVSK